MDEKEKWLKHMEKVISMYVDLHKNVVLLDAKWEPGEIVQFQGKEYKILAYCDTGLDGIEYALEDYPWLVWEHELEDAK